MASRVRTCIARVSIGLNQLTIHVKTSGFAKLAETHLSVKIDTHDETFEIMVPFKVGKARRGALVIKPEGRDIFDLPPVELKKLI